MGWEKKGLTNNQAFMVEPIGEGHAVYYEILQLSLIMNLIWHWNILPALMN